MWPPFSIELTQIRTVGIDTVVFVTKLCIRNGKVTLTSLNCLIRVIVNSSILRNFVKFYCVNFSR